MGEHNIAMRYVTSLLQRFACLQGQGTVGGLSVHSHVANTIITTYFAISAKLISLQQSGRDELRNKNAINCKMLTVK